MHCYISKISIPCVFGFLRDSEYDEWTVKVTTTYGDGRRDVHYESRDNACMTYTIDFIIGFLIGFVCPIILLYLLFWYVFCIVTSIQIYLEERRIQQVTDVSFAKETSKNNSNGKIILPSLSNTKSTMGFQ
jgi:hypothetical protein